MSVSMHEASVRTAGRALTNLIGVLEKGAAYAAAKKVEPSVLVNARLYPDMFPLAKQVQIASDVARLGISRLAQVEAPKYEDNETSFPQLVERLRKTVAHLESLRPEQLEGADTRMVTFPVQGDSRTWPGARYLFTRVLPNVFFHCATAYNILRHNGVEVGKADFLGPIDKE